MISIKDNGGETQHQYSTRSRLAIIAIKSSNPMNSQQPLEVLLDLKSFWYLVGLAHDFHLVLSPNFVLVSDLTLIPSQVCVNTSMYIFSNVKEVFKESTKYVPVFCIRTL